MVTKKSSPKAKNKNSKTPKTPQSKSCQCNFKLLSLILGVLLVVGLICGVCYVKKNHLSYQETQELQAFEGLARNYISNSFEKDGEQGAIVTGYGVTDDKDLYADFAILKYDNHVLLSVQKARLHFQCSQKTDRTSGCAYAYWYGETKETSANFRERYAFYLNEIERLVDAYNSAETDAERTEIRAEEESLNNEEYDALIKEYKEYLGVDDVEE